VARILVIDDEPQLRVIVRMMLEKAGHQVTEAGDGEEGLKLLEKDLPDLILLDVMMPGPSGWEVCHKIKASRRLRDIPLVMFTVRTSKESMEKSNQCGAEAHINKPFDMEEMLETVGRLLDRR
jgi:CheY-like chemotaxis protein